MFLVMVAAVALAQAADVDLRSLASWSLMELEVVAIDVAGRRLTVRHALMAPAPWVLDVAAGAAGKLTTLVRGGRVRVVCRVGGDEPAKPSGRPRCAEVLDMAAPPRWPEGPFRKHTGPPTRVAVEVLAVGPRGQSLRVRALKRHAKDAPGKEWRVTLRGWAREDVRTVRAGDHVRLTCVTEDRLRGQTPEVACQRANAIAMSSQR